MLIKTKNREDAYKAVINTWLKDKTYYCNNCGELYYEGMAQCCDYPQIGTNFDICTALVRQNRELTKSRRNEYASAKGNNLRFGVSIPISLYYTLDNWKKQQGFKGLFSEKGELTWFMKKFKQFTVPEKI